MNIKKCERLHNLLDSFVGKVVTVEFKGGMNGNYIFEDFDYSFNEDGLNYIGDFTDVTIYYNDVTQFFVDEDMQKINLFLNNGIKIVFYGGE